MKMQYGTKRQAVAPVLATLLMIAVAVAMSVIIFMWSQGFLSQTSSATGGQQGAQNQAAQSSIAIESATFVDSTATTPTITVIVRNVGAVAINLGSISVTGSSSNADFRGSIILSFPATGTIGNSATSAWAVSDGTWTIGTTTASTYQSIGKGSAVTISLTGAAAANPGTALTSGDVVNVKVTTSVGTFASAQFTAP